MSSALSAKQLKSLIFVHWNIVCDQIEPLDGYICVNFKIKHGNEDLVLKIFGEEESMHLDCVKFQTRLMVHLENQNGIRTNSLIETRKGDLFATQDLTFSDGSGNSDEVTRRAILLFTYVPGYQLSECSNPSAELFQQVGKFAGHLSNAMQSMHHSGSVKGVPNVWDMEFEHASKVRDYFHILPASERQKLDEILTDCGKAIKGIPLTRGVVHGDMNAQNILMSPKDGLPNGIIDFESAGFSCIIYDLAVLLVHVPIRLGQKEEFLLNAASLLKSFLTEVHLPEQELKLLKYFMMIRTVVNIVMNEYYSVMQPEKADYVKAGVQERYWFQLEQLENLDDGWRE